MKKRAHVIFSLFLATAFTVGMGACSSTEKSAAGPEPKRAPEAAKGATPAPTAKGTVEVQPAAEDISRQGGDEAARIKREELDKLKQEEATKAAAAAALAPEKLEKVYFDFDKHEVADAYRVPLEHTSATLKDHSNTKVVVEGHCDERGTEEYNLALGERRAMAVKTFLISLGVNEGQLYTISYGEERPADTGHDEKSWRQNRRVQFSQE